MSTPTCNGLEMLQAASITLAASTGTAPLSALLNPTPAGAPAPLPAGFVLGKDGKLKKKRGRKPAPGLTDEDRRQARLLKNRRTAEISRRRKLALLNQLTDERDRAQADASLLRQHNQYLIERLARALGLSVEALLNKEAECAPPPLSSLAHSDVSRAISCVESESDHSVKKGLTIKCSPENRE